MASLRMPALFLAVAGALTGSMAPAPSRAAEPANAPPAPQAAVSAPAAPAGEVSARPPAPPAPVSEAPAGPQAAPAKKAAARVSIAVFDVVAGEKVLEDRARSVSALVATRVARVGEVRVVGGDQIRAAVGLEKQKKLLGCTDEFCLAEISGALGVKFVLQGRLDRYGARTVLTAVVVDARSAQSPARMREDVGNDEELLAAADRIGDQALAAIGVQPVQPGPAAAAQPPDETLLHLNVKLGHMLPALKNFSFDGFTFKFELEGDYYVRPFLLAFLEAGVTFGNVTPVGEKTTTFALVPVSLGFKYVFRSDRSLRPYAGLGLGLGLVSALVSAEKQNLTLQFLGFGGIAWFPWRRVGFNVEASVDLNDLALQDGASLLFGFNTNFGVLFAF